MTTTVLTDGDDLHGEELLPEDQAMEFPLGDWNAVVPAINQSITSTSRLYLLGNLNCRLSNPELSCDSNSQINNDLINHLKFT